MFDATMKAVLAEMTEGEQNTLYMPKFPEAIKAKVAQYQKMRYELDGPGTKMTLAAAFSAFVVVALQSGMQAEMDRMAAELERRSEFATSEV